MNNELFNDKNGFTIESLSSFKVKIYNYYFFIQSQNPLAIWKSVQIYFSVQLLNIFIVFSNDIIVNNLLINP
jgi:hypothetical protein